MTGIFGILNVTRDSFSDGGRWLPPAAAIAHGRALLAAGADVLDIGAESTHPDAEDVAAEVEIERLQPVVTALRAAGAAISIDTSKPAVMAAMGRLGVQWINDVGGMRDPEAIAAVAAAGARVVVMFARNGAPRAARAPGDAATLLAEQRAFFVDRLAALGAAGVGRDRIVLDPGMGYFLGAAAAGSLQVLRQLRQLADLGQPLLVSVSRKAFLGEVTGQPVGGRGAASLAAELWAAQHGAAWIRTHDVRALRDGLLVLAAVSGRDDYGRPLAAADPGRS
jgi:dihydropteroate synthase type 2